MTSDKDYRQVYEEFWAPLLDDPMASIMGSSIDMDKLKRELFDYWNLMNNVSLVYEHIADLSKPNTNPHSVIAAHDQALMDAYDNGYKDHSEESGNCNDGYEDGKLDGYDEGYDHGYADGRRHGLDEGAKDAQLEYRIGYDEGYSDGRLEGEERVDF